MSHVDISRVTTLSDRQIEAYEQARLDFTQRGVEDKCPAIYKKAIAGRKRPAVGERCWSPAGKGTSHVGYGYCMAHGGAKLWGRSHGAWLMAHAFAEEYDLSPWESLLYVIRITAGRVRYCERVLAGARDDREIEGGRAVLGPDGQPTPLGVEVGGEHDGRVNEARDLSWWVETSERERLMLAKVSKAAIDAGVAQLLVTREIEQGDLMADSYIRVYDELEAAGVGEHELAIIRDAMKKELMSLGAKDGTRVHHTPGMIEVEGPKD